MTDTNTLAPTGAEIESLAKEYMQQNDAAPCQCTNPWAHDQCTASPGCMIKKKLTKASQPVAVPAGTVESCSTPLPAGMGSVGPWKCGNEYLPYHPSASHVSPEYRAGWNDCHTTAQVQSMQHGSDATLKSRLLIALERASLAECALRALIDECDNDSIPGWEDRMNACINAGNAMLAAAPSGPERKPLTDEQIYAALDADVTAMDVVKQDHESWDVIVQMARAIESAHGITAAQKGGQHAD